MRTLSTAVALTSLSVGASAQSLTERPTGPQSFDGEVSIQRFDPAPGARNFLTTRTTRMQPHKAWTVALMVNYGYKPLTLNFCKVPEGDDQETCENATGDVVEVPVVENVVTGDLMGSYQVLDQLQLGLKVPISYVKGLGQQQDGSERIDDVGLGDPLFEVKGRLYGTAESPLAFGLAGFVTLPFGHWTATDEGPNQDGDVVEMPAYIGDQSVSLGAKAILDGVQGPLSWAVNVGGVYREAAKLGSTELGSEMRYGAAVGYALSPMVRAVVDGFGNWDFSSDKGSAGFELDGALQITPLGAPVTVTAGGGAGLARGIGIPAVRVFLGFIFTSEVDDRDGDGIDDVTDLCPTIAEDMDGIDDADGCPEEEDDGDAVIGADDKCPTEPEDMDGFEDGDGCPEDDNDKDGVSDYADVCPTEPETKNGFKDEDGCPDAPDGDRDGVPDERDKCVAEPEDTDGFEDTDGCPDPDNDGDGVIDVRDECIDQPETKNGFKDEDGCPDEAP